MKLKFKIFVNKFLEFIDKVLRKFGLALIRIRENRIENGSITEGRSLIYITGLDPVTTKIELDKARILSYSLNSKNYQHVNVLALKKALEARNNEDRYQIIEKILIDYSQYNKENESLLAETMRNYSVAIPELRELPPWFVLYPWSYTNDLKKKARLSNFSTLFENVKRGGPHLNADEGGAQHYLINKERAIFEAKLLYDLLRSIEEKGYKPNPGNFDPVGAVLLIHSEDHWCWMVSGGIHRCCVLSALNYDQIDVSIKKVIYREDVADWPNVKNGIFDKENALKFFDNIVRGNANQHHKNWVKHQFGIEEIDSTF